jgi:glucosyl-3-phosphoglycerate synthase
MGDFYQNGIVTTLHNFAQRSTAELESELASFRTKRPTALILPSLYSELEGEALPKIVDKLKQVSYIDHIVIGLDRANESQYRNAIDFFSQLPQRHRILWNDGPALVKVHEALAERDLAPKQAGKGKNVWGCIGYILAATNAEAVALHDCDIVTYERDLLAKLMYPVANPRFNYEFCKGYYARIANNKFNGRVSRLLVSPLIHALKKVLGDLEYLKFMDSFRYSLAGEFSFRRDVLSDLRIPSDWGLEIGILSEMHRNYATNRICQVDIADIYDHKHQALSADNDEAGLSKMSIDISKALIRKLATQGTTFSAETFRTIKATYYRTALDYVDAYHNDALLNNLNFDIHQEEAAIELFAENIIKAGEIYLDRPMDTPFIPSWNRVQSAIPNILERIADAVEQDHQRYSY